VDIPAEENAWVEQALSDVIEDALATVAQVRRARHTQLALTIQDYVQSRTATFAQAASSVAGKAQTETTGPGNTEQA